MNTTNNDLDKAYERYEESKNKFNDAVRAYKVSRLLKKLKWIFVWVVTIIIVEIVLALMFSTWMPNL